MAEAKAMDESYQKLRHSAAWWRESDQSLIRVSGKDAASYLQTQLTQDLLALAPGQAAPAALVQRKGQIQALMLVLHQNEEFWLLPSAGSQKLHEHLEAFHFVEQVEVGLESGWLRLRLEGPACFETLRELSGQSLAGAARLSLRSLAIPGGSVWALIDSYSGESGVLLLCRPDYAQTLLQLIQDAGLAELSPAAFETMRLEAGQPAWGKDMDEQTLLPETGLEKLTVNYDKGCYLGQEVIARIRSYGVVPRALIGLSAGQAMKAGPLRLAGKEIGRITSSGYSPLLDKFIALAYVHKSQRENGRSLQLETAGGPVDVTLRRLPFYTPPSAGDQARDLLNQALEIFANQDESRAIPLLEAALAKDPHLADAYESLGVILSRQGRLEEAIAVMRQLAELDPLEPMAQTNLSRFYMLLGDKETAEQHMAEAMRLNMLRSQQAFAAEQQAKRDSAQKLELMNMFREVLESEDPDDLVANFGLGKALFDSGQAEQALPYLRKATQVEPLYSAAWLQLGKAAEQIKDLPLAAMAYRRGIEAASEKGDLMPLKEMEQRLQSLTREGSADDPA